MRDKGSKQKKRYAGKVESLSKFPKKFLGHLWSIVKAPFASFLSSLVSFDKKKLETLKKAETFKKFKNAAGPMKPVSSSSSSTMKFTLNGRKFELEDNPSTSRIHSRSHEVFKKLENTATIVSKKKQLDLVFIMDCTASMSPYIKAAKNNIRTIVQKLIASQNCHVRFGLVAYRDHPPQESSFVTKVFEFEENISVMQKNLNGLSASGGGDGPEALTAGLFVAENLSYRENATKIVILIADAPPHGLEENGDGFPEGDPNGHDPLLIARSMAGKGITIYAVGCEPALGRYRHARAFFVFLSEITSGQAISLGSSSLLADVILGGAVEELGLQSLAAQYSEDIAEISKEVASSSEWSGTTNEERTAETAKRLFLHLKNKSVCSPAMKTDGRMADSSSAVFSFSHSLNTARNKLKDAGHCFGRDNNPASMSFGADTKSDFGAATFCTTEKAPISLEKTRKIVESFFSK